MKSYALIVLLLVAVTLDNVNVLAQNDSGIPTNPCAAVLCPTGTTCVAKPVQCIRAPCPAIPECVPQEPTCENKTCSDGDVCKLIQVQCIRAPCPPLPQCVSAKKEKVRAPYLRH